MQGRLYRSIGREARQQVNEAEDPGSLVVGTVEPVKTRIPERLGFYAMQDIQVLCPMNRSGAGARAFNIEPQVTLNPAPAA